MLRFLARCILVLFHVSVVYMQAQESIVTFSKADGLSSIIITTTYVDSKGIVWVGTTNGLNAFTGKEWIAIKNIEDNQTARTKPLGNIYLIFEDLAANVWVSTEKGLFLYNREYWIFFEPESDEAFKSLKFYQDRSGAVWITQERVQDFSSEMGFSLVSGKLQMYYNHQWYKFDEEASGTATIRYEDLSAYYTAFFQDMAGNIWLATLEGILMFNGNDWVKYQEEELEAKKIYDLIEDAGGTIWAATDRGVLRKEKDEWRKYSKDHGLADDQAFRLLDDPQGRIWAFSRNDIRFTGLSLFSEDQWIAFNTGECYLKGEVNELAWSGNDVFAFSDAGVSVFRDKKWHKQGKDEGLTDKNYSLIMMEKSGDILLAGDYNLYQFIDGTWKVLMENDEKWEVLTVYHDKRSRLWVATDKSGLYLLDSGGITHYTEENGLPDNHISTLFEDRHKNIWVVTRKGLAEISKGQL